MKNNSKSKAQKVIEAIQEADDPVRREVEAEFGKMVKVFGPDEDTSEYLKKLALAYGKKWE